MSAGWPACHSGLWARYSLPSPPFPHSDWPSRPVKRVGTRRDLHERGGEGEGEPVRSQGLCHLPPRSPRPRSSHSACQPWGMRRCGAGLETGHRTGLALLLASTPSRFQKENTGLFLGRRRGPSRGGAG